MIFIFLIRVFRTITFFLGAWFLLAALPWHESLKNFSVAGPFAASYFWIRGDMWGNKKSADLVSRQADSFVAFILLLAAALIYGFAITDPNQRNLFFGLLCVLYPVGHCISLAIKQISRLASTT